MQTLTSIEIDEVSGGMRLVDFDPSAINVEDQRPWTLTGAINQFSYAHFGVFVF